MNKHLSTLELKEGASAAEIKDAYRDLAQVWHPDRFAHDPKLQAKAEEKLKLINQAYEALKKAPAEKPPETVETPPDIEAFKELFANYAPKKPKRFELSALLWVGVALSIYISAVAYVYYLNYTDPPRRHSRR